MKRLLFKTTCFLLVLALVVPCLASCGAKEKMTFISAPSDVADNTPTSPIEEFVEIIYDEHKYTAGSSMSLTHSFAIDTRLKERIDSDEYDDYRFAVYLLIYQFEDNRLNGPADSSKAIEYFGRIGVEITPADPENVSKKDVPANELYEAVLSRDEIYALCETLDKEFSEHKFRCAVFGR